MKKIALLFAMIVCAVSGAMAQDETTAKDSVFVVIGDSVAGAYAISDGDYVTFTRPVSEWTPLLTDATTYFWNGSSYDLADYKYTTTIYQYKGKQNYFFIDNFMNSGTGFTFKIKNADGTYPETVEDINAIDGILEPVDNEGTSAGTDYGTCVWYAYYTNGEWGWVDSVNNVNYTGLGFYIGDGYSTFKGTGKWIGLTGYWYIDSKATYTTMYIQW